MIRLITGLLLTFGAVGGMDDPALADHLLEQCLAALVGLLLIFWASRDLDNRSDRKYN